MGALQSPLGGPKDLPHEPGGPRPQKVKVRGPGLCVDSQIRWSQDLPGPDSSTCTFIHL